MADQKIIVRNSAGQFETVKDANTAVAKNIDNPSGDLVIGANASSATLGNASAPLTLKGSIVNIEGPVNQVAATSLAVQDVTIATNVSAGPDAPEADFSGLVIHRGDVAGTPRHRFYIGYEANDARIDFYRDTNGDGAFAAWAGVYMGALQVNDNFYQDGTQFTAQNTGAVTIRSTGGLIKIDARAGWQLVDDTAPILSIADGATDLEVGTGYTLKAASGAEIIATQFAGTLRESGTTTGLAAGDVVYASAFGVYAKASNASTASATLAGVYDGVAGKIVNIAGVVVEVNYVSADGDPGTGPLFVSSTAGKVTKDAPADGSGAYQAFVGKCEDNTNYASGKVKVRYKGSELPAGPF